MGSVSPPFTFLAAWRGRQNHQELLTLGGARLQGTHLSTSQRPLSKKGARPEGLVTCPGAGSRLVVEPDQGWDLIGQCCCGVCLCPIEISATWTEADPRGGGAAAQPCSCFLLGGVGDGFNTSVIGIS